MTRFTDGPAAGKTLCLRRAPVFLRVVIDGEDIDALDQLDDKPEPNEKLYVYIRDGDAGSVHIDGRDPKTGKRFGRWMMTAKYKLYATQPDDATLRDFAKWSEWCHAEWKRLNEAATPDPKKGGT